MPSKTEVIAPQTVAASPEAVTPATDSRRGPAGPVLAETDFQRFAEDSSGESLPVYGRELFQSVPSTFSPVDQGPVPANYVIGPQDQLLIRVWGAIDLDSRVTVDRNGQIFLPKIGTLNVAGLRYDQLNSFLRSSIGAIYKDFQLNVALGQLRAIQICVVGNARRPGVYTVSAFSTLVDALFASGGPSATGTMRQIELRRSGKLVASFDIYVLLQKGDKSSDVHLLPGDVIYIPPVGPQVAVVGNVNTPGIFELKGDTSIQSLLQYAGGLTPLADTNRVLLERIENHTDRITEEFSLNAAGLKHGLADGDVLRISPVSPQFGKTITLKGNVAQPGRYPWHEGMRVADLIPSRDALISRQYWNRENHLVHAPMGHEFAIPPSQTRPTAGNADHSESSTVASIASNDAEIDWNYAVIERLDPRDLSTHLIPFHLGHAIDHPESSEDPQLLAGDVITIFSRKDLPLPIQQESMYVRVSGELKVPGVYRVHPGDTLRDLVARAGGLTPYAYLYAAQLTRVSTREAQREQLQTSTREMERELLSHSPQPSLVSTDKSANQQAQFAMQQAMIARLASIQPTGRVVLAMKPDARTTEDIPNFPLEDGDSFYVPPKVGTVEVFGAVYNQSAFRYLPGKKLGAYLADAGGATRDADIKRAFLIRADGTVVSRRRAKSLWGNDFDSLAILPGDAIVIPTKIKGVGGLNDFMGVTQILSETALTAAALSVIQQ